MKNEVLRNRPSLLEINYTTYNNTKINVYQSYYDNDELYQRPYIRIVQYMDIRISF